MGHRVMSWILWTTLTLLGTPHASRALTEKELANRGWNTVLEPFFRSGVLIEFQGADGLALKGIRFANETAQDTVLFLPGFSEPWIKYIELLHDLHRSGYEVLSYDHRGQGASPRLAKSNPDAVHLEHFEDHVSVL